MKKILSIVISFIMITLLLPVQSAVFAEDSELYTVKYFNTFEDEATSGANITSYNNGEYEIDSSTYADTIGNKNVLKMVADGGKRGIDINFDKPISISEDISVEIELDFAFKLISSDNQMKMCINTSNYILFMASNSFRTENPNATISKINSANLSRYKITLKPEVSGEKRFWAITDLVVDGKDVIDDGVTYPSTLADSDISKLRLRFGGNNQEDIVYIDNISVTTYFSQDGVSPVPDKYSLLSKIRQVSETAQQSFENNEITEGVLAGINEKVNSALTVLQTETSDEKSFSEQLSNLDSVESVINAYKEMNQSGAAYSLDEENAAVSGDILSDTQISVNIPVYTAAGDTKTSLKLLGLLYKDNADCVTPELVSISKAAAELEPDSIGKAEITFDLSSYSDRSGLSAKLLVVEDYSELTDSIATAEAATREDSVSTDGYSFISDVNVSKVILNDDLETEDFKMVYALKGKAGSKVSLLAAKPVSNESESAFEGISEAPEAVIEYYNTAVFDENGKAVFEFVPQSGMGYYDYIINCGDYSSPYEGRFFYASLGNIDTIIEKIYADKTLDNLSSEETDAVFLGESVISDARKAGVSVDSVLEDVLAEKDYDARTLSEFTSSLFNKLKIVTLFRTSDSADTVMVLTDTYSSDVEELAKVKSLSTSQKRQKAYVYIYENNKSIVDMSTLKTVAEKAVTEANKTTTQTSGGSSGVSTGSSSVSYSGGSSGGSSGGGSYASVASPSVKEENSLTVMQEAQLKFNDLDSVSWAQQAIVEFAANGWITGKADGIFAPADSVTREEFVKIVVNVFGLYDENAVCNFKDTDENQWYYPYIASASAKGIVNGISDDCFGIGSTISRQDMAVIVYRTAVMNNLNLTEDGEYIPFADEVKISEYALDAVVELSKSGIINGMENNSFVPEGLATRAEAVKMLYGAHKLK